MLCRSSAAVSLLVAWRWKRLATSLTGMPQPLSTTRTPSSPPATTSTRTDVAPASSAFSTSSLTADAGRSTTSPAAIRAATSWGSTRMGMASVYHRGEGGLAARGLGLRWRLHARNAEVPRAGPSPPATQNPGLSIWPSPGLRRRRRSGPGITWTSLWDGPRLQSVSVFPLDAHFGWPRYWGANQSTLSISHAPWYNCRRQVTLSNRQ